VTISEDRDVVSNGTLGHPEDPVDAKRSLIARTIAGVERRRRRVRTLVVLCRFGVIIVALGLWELLSGRVVDEIFVSRPSDIIAALVNGIAERRLLEHAWITTSEAGLGFLIGVTVAIVLALVIDSVPRAHEVIEPIVMAIYGIPKVALAPLFIIWFGLGITSKIAISGFMVFFIVFISAVAGLSRTPTGMIQVARMMGAGRAKLLWQVRLPSASPEIFTALKIVVPISMIGAVVGEFVSSQRGLGFFITRATLSFDTAAAFSGVFMLMTIVLLMTAVLRFADSRLLRWRSDKDQFVNLS
jgi:NitT/TauT family transport system permease protein